MHIAHRYKTKIKSFESAKTYKEDFDAIIASVLKRAKATPTERTETVMVSVDPRDSKVIIPTQRKIFAFDNF